MPNKSFHLTAINLSKIVEKLKNIPNKDIADTLQDSQLKETYFRNSLMLNGLAKKIPVLEHNYSDSTSKFCLVWGQVILRAYAVFICMRNDLLESQLISIDKSSSLHLFKQIFEKDENQQTISTELPIGLCRRIRNSIAHGSFRITGENGEIGFQDGYVELLVGGYEFTQLCDQIERLYLCAYPIEGLKK